MKHIVKLMSRIVILSAALIALAGCNNDQWTGLEPTKSMTTAKAGKTYM